MEPLVDLVVVTYNAPQELMQFFLSLEKHADVPFTLTVINNNGQNGQLRHVVEKWRWKEASTAHLMTHYYQVSQSNVGYAQACNQGALIGDQTGRYAPYLILLNDDVKLTPGCLSKLLAHFDRPEYADVGILGPRQVSSEGVLTHGGIVTVNGRDTLRFWKAKDYGQANDEFDAPTVSGSVYAVRREMWDELTECAVYDRFCIDNLVPPDGAFLPTPHYYEETWCSYHARDHGWGVRYQGDVAFIHEWHRSSPVGGIAETEYFKKSEAMFRAACAAHAIELEF